MIIVPVLLKEVLAEVDVPARRRIALDFARHVLDVCGDAFDDAHRDVVTAYLTAAVDAEADADRFAALVDARARFFASRRGDVSSLPHRVGWAVDMAVDLCFLHDFRAAKIVISGSAWVPSLHDVAHEAQGVVGEHAVQGSDRQSPKDVRFVRRAARWEEARWQLIHVIGMAPIPPDRHPET